MSSASPQKVSLYSTNDLKNATDDSLAPYLTTLPKPYTFTQQHTKTDVHLLLGYTAVLIAAVLFYADYKLGWAATKAYTGPACVAYFVLNGALTYWIWAVEAGTVFVGIREGGQKLTLKSSTQKYKPIYKLKVTYEAPSGKRWEDKEMQGSFTQWFNTHGYLQKKELYAWLAGNIEVIGLAETEKEMQTKTKDTGSTSIPLAVEAEPSSFSTGAVAEDAGVTATSSAKKGRGKKKA
ncbi:signal peptidase complex subunit spc2 [Exophiala dermatitidis]|uniref:Signal peptidase complex subunit 2 n=2 Tax=Exophiala dermatitidis TaxID=5970 RepID=H6C6W8_EXODN|nr:uncharacterized protein HMPREF1120_07453 [Exophiala dermatitidis NIH/UT8656]KAJ4522767.1 signal peptidase complex subunit spc2 [Exophiala dermatitidis]EHY59464.1 hypothetical protein HMPREF1120_07453 [Exophiala dermatitidis NIH/UT8656]KAJ4526072.1 signal peptidase complex subunit spc2 [Exophiala dermatitidis]KAJ4526983.1 signal peptidase complex subunit spc2 [Exophiala dermatitidis]KAJ4532697.1 signal peptidase complex subunit spc2 [Exophiala dermatitidis]